MTDQIKEVKFNKLFFLSKMIKVPSTIINMMISTEFEMMYFLNQTEVKYEYINLLVYWCFIPKFIIQHIKEFHLFKIYEGQH